jgi:hypothetical protein
MVQIKTVQKIKTNILCPITSLSEKRAVCELMEKNMVNPDRTPIL